RPDRLGDRRRARARGRPSARPRHSPGGGGARRPAAAPLADGRRRPGGPVRAPASRGAAGLRVRGGLGGPRRGAPARGGCRGGVFYPAATGLLPAIVAPDRLQQANGLRAMGDGTARIAAPAVAGVIVVAASPGWVIGVDAATFAVSAAALVLLRLPAHVPPER